MDTPFSKAHFKLSAPDLAHLPHHDAEIAFMGRSNVGKSSTLNALTRQKKLAKTSKTPGRTQAINVFALDEHTALLDFPGLGFAKVPPSMTKAWLAMIEQYLDHRKSLALLVIIMDMRHPLQPYDQSLLSFCHDLTFPIHIVLNKADCLTRHKQNQTLQQVKQHTLCHTLGKRLTLQAFSTKTKQGLDELEQALLPFVGDF